MGFRTPGIGERLRAALGEGLREQEPLRHHTTFRVGGPADWFLAARTQDQLVTALRVATELNLPSFLLGGGSNLLVSDEGFRGVVLKLGGDLTAIERQGTKLICGGGARLPSASAKAAGWGLAGLEFGVNIPGTVGGAVRMNANAYGGELGRVLEEVTVCTAAGADRRRPADLGFRYRRSNLGDREVVSAATFALTEADPAEVKATMGAMRRRRKEAQPSGIKTFGSTFVNPAEPRAEGRSAGQLLDAAGCRGLQVGGARLSQKHANFVENSGTATTADILAVMAKARHEVYERFGVVLEPEVQILGEVEWPEEWEIGR